MKEKLNLTIPSELKKDIKRYAIDYDLTASQVVQCIFAWLDDNRECPSFNDIINYCKLHGIGGID